MKPPTVTYKRVGVPPASAATSRYNVLVDGKEVGWVERVPRLRRGYGRWSGRPTTVYQWANNLPAPTLWPTREAAATQLLVRHAMRQTTKPTTPTQ